MFFAITAVGGSGEEGFLLIWKNVGLTIGCLFVFWQMWVFVRFATSWSKSWYQVSEPRYPGDKVTFYLMIDYAHFPPPSNILCSILRVDWPPGSVGK